MKRLARVLVVVASLLMIAAAVTGVAAVWTGGATSESLAGTAVLLGCLIGPAVAICALFAWSEA